MATTTEPGLGRYGPSRASVIAVACLCSNELLRQTLGQACVERPPAASETCNSVMLSKLMQNGSAAYRG